MRLRRTPPADIEATPAPPATSAMPSGAPFACPAAENRRSRRAWLWCGGGLVLLAGLAAAGWYAWHRGYFRQIPEPPLPEIEEEEVRRVVKEQYQRLLQDRRSGTAWGEYGTILLAHLFDREADACFVVAMRLSPQDPRWPYARAHIALKRRPQEGPELLRAAAKAANSPEYQSAITLTLAEALLEQGQIDEAERLFLQQLNTPLGSARARFGLGVAALAREDYAAAEQHFLAVRDQQYCRKQAHTHLAMLARARGDILAARRYESIACASDPDPPWPDPYLDHVVSLQVGHRGLERRATLLERDGRYFDAAQLYFRAVQQRKDAKYLIGAAVNLARLFRHPEAIGLLRQAVEAEPDNSQAHYTLGLVLYAHAEIVQSREPDHPELTAWFREAAAATARAAELRPDHAQSYLFHGLSLLRLGQARQAIPAFRKGLTIQPDNFELHLGLGEALLAVGEAAEAEKILAVARELRPDDPRPAQLLGRLRNSR